MDTSPPPQHAFKIIEADVTNEKHNITEVVRMTFEKYHDRITMKGTNTAIKVDEYAYDTKDHPTHDQIPAVAKFICSNPNTMCYARSVSDRFPYTLYVSRKDTDPDDTPIRTFDVRFMSNYEYNREKANGVDNPQPTPCAYRGFDFTEAVRYYVTQRKRQPIIDWYHDNTHCEVGWLEGIPDEAIDEIYDEYERRTSPTLCYIAEMKGENLLDQSYMPSKVHEELLDMDNRAFFALGMTFDDFGSPDFGQLSKIPFHSVIIGPHDGYDDTSSSWVKDLVPAYGPKFHVYCTQEIMTETIKDIERIDSYVNTEDIEKRHSEKKQWMKLMKNKAAAEKRKATLEKKKVEVMKAITQKKREVAKKKKRVAKRAATKRAATKRAATKKRTL